MSAFLKSGRRRRERLYGGLLVAAVVSIVCGCQPNQRIGHTTSATPPHPSTARESAPDQMLERSVAPDTRSATRVAVRPDEPRLPESDLDRIFSSSPSRDSEPATEAEGMAHERWLKRLNEDGEIPPNALVEAKKQADLVPELPLSRGQRDAGLWAWQWLGPGNIGGRIRSILIHPNDPDTMWIGGVSGGIWRTDNAGAHWDPLDDFMASLAVTSIVMDPTDSDIMYAATGEGITGGNGAFSVPGAGVFVTTDGGDSWNQLPATSGWAYVNRLAHHPTQSGVLFAATNNNGVLRTTDGGVTWLAVLYPSFRATDVEIDSTAPSRVVVGTLGEVWLSLSDGDTGSWVLQTTDVDSDGDGEMDNLKLPSTDLERCELTFGTGGMIWLSMNRNDGEIWNSTDGGTTWALLNSGEAFLCNPVAPTSCQGNYDNTIWASPDDPDLVVVGGIDLFRSTDGGTTLTQISDWRDYENGGGFSSAHADQHFIAAPPDYGPSNRTLFVANDGGIQQMSDVYTVGQNSGWTNLANNLGITQFFGGAASPTGSVIIGGTQDNDQLRYRPGDGIHGWYQATTGDGGYVAVDYDDPSVLYGEWPELTMRKSTDGGDTYWYAKNGLSDAGTAALFVAPFVMAPSAPEILVAGGESIWRTTNSAGNWGLIRAPISGNHKCSAIDISATDSDRIIVGYTNGRVSGTGDGSTWSDLDEESGSNDDVPNRWVTDIAINPLNKNEIFVTLGTYANDSIWYTSNAGTTWQLRQGTAPNEVPAIHISTIRFHPTNPNWVYVGTDLGIFASEDKGLNWNRTPSFGSVEHDGPVNVEVAELFWQGDEYLVAATFGRGMFRARPLVIVYVDEANAGDPDENGSQAHPYDLVQEGIATAGHGTDISIEAGDYDETGVTIFSKRGTVVATNGSVVIH